MQLMGTRTLVTRAKVNLVGTVAGDVYERLRWAASSVKRHRHPELMDFYLEPYRFDFVMSHLVRETDHCFDGGCHVGSVLAQMVRLAPAGRHIAVEPVPHKAEALARRFPKVRIVPGALGSAPGTMTFYDHHSGFASFHPDRHHHTADDARDVQVHTIDDLVGDERLDLLKLDIEGAELWALEGARETVRRESPTIVIECGRDGVLEPFGYRRDDMYSYVTGELGYAVYSIVDFMYGRDPMSQGEFSRAGVYPFRGFNYVCIPADGQPARLVPEFTREQLF